MKSCSDLDVDIKLLEKKVTSHGEAKT